MKTFRKLMKNYAKEVAFWALIGVCAWIIGLIAFALMALPGVAIAYLCNCRDVSQLVTAGAISIAIFGALHFIAKGVWKVCKDYQVLKREDNEEE